ncbi:DUF456 domain-containing protein [Rhodohalobacter halophilus]|uniref:DUF456 domain-containing protein n=1 Tax=Rhodohalobacter halophilus TaxID=1812810 RepID=UPI00083F9087|nr:DUF456 domain-containing protein [Rhodohalobacter halophilus]
MEIILITLGALLMITGLIGAFLPVLPGLPFSYAGLLMLQLTEYPPFSLRFMIVWAVIVVMIQFLEQIATVAGAKKMGASSYGIWGSIIGAIVGFIIFPPFGIVFGPIAGAYAGELINKKTSREALRSAMGAVLGFFVSTFIKVVAALIMTYHFVINAFW